MPTSDLDRATVALCQLSYSPSLGASLPVRVRGKVTPNSSRFLDILDSAETGGMVHIHPSRKGAVMAPRDRGQHQFDQVDQVEVYLVTGAESDAGTDGEVYLLLGGREFNIKRADINDRQPRAQDRYVLGQGATIEHKDRNDPRQTEIFMVWDHDIGLRFEPQADTITPDAWHLREAWLYIRAGGFEDFAWLSPGQWLGWHYGLTTTQFQLQIQDEDKTPNEKAKEYQSRQS